MTGILTLNTGSSSLKFALYRAAPRLQILLHGQVDRIGKDATLVVYQEDRKTSARVEAATPNEALQAVMAFIQRENRNVSVAGVGHRIVHGGPKYAEPVLLCEERIAELEALVPLAPLHQPHNLAGIKTARDVFPNAVQIGCFDTGFHHGHPWVNDTFALPRHFYDEGIRRYGFHGLSYEYITGLIAAEYPDLHAGKLVIAHLGNGASMCAVREGKSVGSTMGFSALDGLPMGTRSGQIDPGVILYLLEEKGMRSSDILHMLYHESGLLGLSGLTSDMRDLLEAGTPEAAQAIDYYVFRARREVGALSAVLGGIDGLVFCGGIGENAKVIRARIVEGLAYLGIVIDPEKDTTDARDIGQGGTRVLVIPTDEERVIARAVRAALVL
ncbi:MAG: acetate/propionate family kinase [Roseobacter sp.]